MLFFSWKRIVLSIWCKVKFLLRLPMVFWDIKKFKNVCSWICHSLLLWLWGFMPKFRNTFLIFRLLKYPPFFSFIVSLVLFYSFKFWPIWSFCGCVVWGRDPTFPQVVMRAFCILTELCVLGSLWLDRLWLSHGALVKLHWALEGAGMGGGRAQGSVPYACNNDTGGLCRKNIKFYSKRRLVTHWKRRNWGERLLMED